MLNFTSSKYDQGASEDIEEEERPLKPHEIKDALSGFIGTENYHAVYPRVYLSDGVQFLCEHARSLLAYGNCVEHPS